MIQLRPYPCPHLGCGHHGEPLRGRDPVRRSKGLWLCESCRGPLPIKTPRQRRRVRKWEDE